MTDDTNQQQSSSPQPQDTNNIPLPDPQALTSAPNQNLSNEFKGSEQSIPQPSNINNDSVRDLSNEIKKNFQMTEENNS